MLAAGLELLVVGMGTVFAFLGLMVLLMHASARVFSALQPATAAPQTADLDNDDAEIALVLAAVAAQRRRKAAGSTTS